jgi:hypothetical protein
MKRTTTVATHQLQPTVHIDAVPELARERERMKERERVKTAGIRERETA